MREPTTLWPATGPGPPTLAAARERGTAAAGASSVPLGGGGIYSLLLLPYAAIVFLSKLAHPS